MTIDYVLERAKRGTSASEFQRNYYPLYVWARDSGFMPNVDAILPRLSPSERAKVANAARAYTAEELIDNAAQFKTRTEWRIAGEQERLAGKYSHYGAAIKHGHEFMDRCCAHMQNMRGRNTPVQYLDEEVATSAAKFQHRNDWKVAEPHYYQAALRRGLMDKVATHMIPKANPYSGSYIIYAYEFADRHAYAGLTFLGKARHAQHMTRGPVFRHTQVCPTYEYKIVEKGLASPVEAAAAEGKWIKHYTDAGWSMLNTARAGGLGTINIGKWTKEAILAKANEFKTRKAWYLGSQYTYSLAKREGWFEEATAHMPRRVLGIGVGRHVSEETKAKQAAAKIGVAQSAASRHAKSIAIKTWWAARRSSVN